MGSAHHQHRATRRATHFEDVDLQMLPDAVGLARQLLAHRQHRLDPLAHVEHDCLVGGAVHHAGHDLALAADVLAVDHVTLGFTQALAVHLCRGLGSDSAELGLRHVLRHSHPTADAGRRVDLLRLGDEHLQLGIGHLVGRGDHLVLPEDADLARLGIDADHHVLRRVGIATVGRFNRLLEGLDENLLGNALLGIQLEQSSNEVPVHNPHLARGRNKNVGLANRPTLLRNQYVWSAHGRRNRDEV